MTAVLPFRPDTMTPAQLAAVSFLARYTGRTHEAYTHQLRCWFDWCETNGLDPLEGIQRAHVELYIRQMVDRGLMVSTVNTNMHGIRGYFKFAHIDGLIPGDPAVYARLPKAASVRIEDYKDTVRGHRVLRLVGKGNKPATIPLTVPVLRALDDAKGDRTEGPLLLRPYSGQPADRRDVYRMVLKIAKEAGIKHHISPHSLRHAAITNALDSGVTLRDAQILARHADPRTTEHYDRARGNLDRHGVHFLTAYVAGV